MFEGVFLYKREVPKGTLDEPLEEVPEDVEIPQDEDLETWNGLGRLNRSFLSGDNQYVGIYFDHDCGEDSPVPSNSTEYIYLYDDSDGTESE